MTLKDRSENLGIDVDKVREGIEKAVTERWFQSVALLTEEEKPASPFKTKSNRTPKKKT